jgi:hypothetical protein
MSSSSLPLTSSSSSLSLSVSSSAPAPSPSPLPIPLPFDFSGVHLSARELHDFWSFYSSDPNSLVYLDFDHFLSDFLLHFTHGLMDFGKEFSKKFTEKQENKEGKENQSGSSNTVSNYKESRELKELRDLWSIAVSEAVESINEAYKSGLTEKVWKQIWEENKKHSSQINSNQQEKHGINKEQFGCFHRIISESLLSAPLKKLKQTAIKLRKRALLANVMQ